MRRHTRGFSLIELLVGASVALLTLLAVAAAFIAFYQGVYSQEGMRAGQASIRQSMHGLSRHLRMAGYGLEPYYAFDFPAGWRGVGPSNNYSDRLIIRSRDPLFSAAVTQAASGSVRVARLPVALRQGQIIQVICPGAYDWSYGQLSANVAASEVETVLPLVPATGTFPLLNASFDRGCFDGVTGLPARVFKVDVYDYALFDLEDDGVPATPPVRPFLFRGHGLGAPSGLPALGEPVAENIEALRFTFLRADGSAFTPDPAVGRPEYATEADSPLRTNNHPANIRAVRVGVVSRASSPDQATQQAALETTIPGFAGRPDIVNAPAGYRRTHFEMTVFPRNMRSSQMPLPSYTSDTSPAACNGTLPVDGLTCAGG